jgi:hypothetical protein
MPLGHVGEWRYSCTIHDLRTRCRWVVSFTPRPLYPGSQLDKRLGGPQSRNSKVKELWLYILFNQNSYLKNLQSFEYIIIFTIVCSPLCRSHLLTLYEPNAGWHDTLRTSVLRGLLTFMHSGSSSRMRWRRGHPHSVAAFPQEKISPIPTALNSDWIYSRCQRDGERTASAPTRSRTSAIQSRVIHYTDLTVTDVLKISLIWSTLLKFIFISPKFLETRFRNHRLTAFCFTSFSTLCSVIYLRGFACNCFLASQHAVELTKFIDVLFLFTYVCSNVRHKVAL